MPSSMSCKLKLTKSVVQISKSDIPKDGMSFQIKIPLLELFHYSAWLAKHKITH